MSDEIYVHHAEMCKVFSHPKRLELIDVLRDREMTVSDLAQRLEMTSANLSQHLAMMRERRILTSRKDGNLVYYRIVNAKLLLIFNMMRDLLFDQIRQDVALLDARSK